MSTQFCLFYPFYASPGVNRCLWTGHLSETFYKQKKLSTPQLVALYARLAWVVLISPTFFPLSKAGFLAPCKLAHSGYVLLAGDAGNLAKSDGEGHPSSYHSIISFICFMTFGSQVWGHRFSHFGWSLDTVHSQASTWTFLLMISAELTRRY